MQRDSSLARSPIEAPDAATALRRRTRKGFFMRHLTKGLLGAFAAISVAATAPAYAGLSTPAPAQAPALFKAAPAAGFYPTKRHNPNSSRDQRVRHKPTP